MRPRLFIGQRRVIESELDPLQGLPNQETVLQRIHPDDRERVDVETEKALRQKRDFALEFRIILPDGTVKYIESTGRPLFSADGNLVEMVATHIDVTARKRAEEEHGDFAGWSWISRT